MPKKDNTNPSVEPKDKQVPEYSNVIKGKKAILRQYQTEKEYAIKVRQTKINNWLKNEESYNGVVQRTLLTRSNLHVPVVFEGVHNMASKLGAMPDLEFDTVPEGDENASDIMEHVVKEDLKDSMFELLWEDTKIEAGIYGRGIWEVIPGNDKNKVELVDTLAFLISPIARDTKKANYCGRQFIYKTMEQLEDEKDEMEYDQEELNKLKTGKIPNETQQENSSEASAKNLRLANMGLSNTTQYGSKVAELTSWWTYIGKKGKSELYNVVVANDLYVLRVKKASELGLKRPPFISWGTYRRGITFWCPSVADVYRDPNLAVDVSINQGIDNNTYRNFGMLFVSSSSGLKQSSIVPRPLGVTPVTTNQGEKVQDKVWQFTPPEITSALTTMQTIKGFADSASGLNINLPSRTGKLSVTQMSKLNADLEARIVIMKRNATLAFQELCQVMADITASKLTSPRKVKIFGYKDLTLEGVTKDNFKDVELKAVATPSEDSAQNKAIRQKAKIDLYTLFKDDPKIPGQVAMRRSVAKTFDIPPTEIEEWFTPDKDGQAKQDLSVIPNMDGKAPTDATPDLQQTGREAQINVPPSI